MFVGKKMVIDAGVQVIQSSNIGKSVFLRAITSAVDGLAVDKEIKIDFKLDCSLNVLSIKQSGSINKYFTAGDGARAVLGDVRNEFTGSLESLGCHHSGDANAVKYDLVKNKDGLPLDQPLSQMFKLSGFVLGFDVPDALQDASAQIKEYNLFV